MDPSIAAYRAAVGRALDAIDEVYETRRGLRPAATQDDLDDVSFLDGHLHYRLSRCAGLLRHLPGYLAHTAAQEDALLNDLSFFE